MAQKRSVPWCCKSHMWQYFTSEKCLQTFATELDAVMCLMSKTEKFDFRTIKCNWAALVKKTLSLYGHNLGVARMVWKQLYCCSEQYNHLNANTVVAVLCSRNVYTCVKASVGKSVCVQKRLCVKASACKTSVCMSLCVKASVCKSLCVWKCVCV